jgi:uncharacterized membrane protein YbhN (UPF0104 family)
MARDIGTNPLRRNGNPSQAGRARRDPGYGCRSGRSAGWRAQAGGSGSGAKRADAHLGQAWASAILMATEFSICITPAGSGGPLTYSRLLNRHGLTHSRSLGLNAADRFVDMLFFCALCIVLLQWLLAPPNWHLGWQLGSMMIFLVRTVLSLRLLADHCRFPCSMTGGLLRGLGISLLVPDRGRTGHRYPGGQTSLAARRQVTISILFLEVTSPLAVGPSVVSGLKCPGGPSAHRSAPCAPRRWRWSPAAAEFRCGRAFQQR